MILPFFTLDVFTDRRLAGNPLAIVRDCDQLDGAAMQAIAREFNLSETVFLLEPRDPVNSARVRIFTPGREIAFAGHPIVGTAVMLAEIDAPEIRQELLVVLELGDLQVQCTVRSPHGRATRAQFDLPRLPVRMGDMNVADAAAALGLQAEDIGFGDHLPGIYSAGTPFCFVPVKSRDILSRARPAGEAWERTIGALDFPAVFVYANETEDQEAHVRARMFAPDAGVPEDPATGSAAAAFAGVCMDFEKPEDGDHLIIIEQGQDMGRPSQIVLGMQVANGVLTGASIGGGAVFVSRGTLEI